MMAAIRIRRGRVVRLILLILAMSVSAREDLAAQEWLGGLATGTIGGFLVGTGAVSTKAIVFDRPPYGVSEGLSLALRVTAAGAAAGAVIGLAAPERTANFARDASLGALVGGLAGLGLGYIVEAERPLGVMTIGMGLGILGGTLVALLEDDTDLAIGAERSVEVVVLKIGL